MTTNTFELNYIRFSMPQEFGAELKRQTNTSPGNFYETRAEMRRFNTWSRTLASEGLRVTEGTERDSAVTLIRMYSAGRTIEAIKAMKEAPIPVTPDALEMKLNEGVWTPAEKEKQPETSAFDADRALTQRTNSGFYDPVDYRD